jgi:hypothetical protein
MEINQMKFDKILTKEFLEEEYTKNKKGPYYIAKMVGATVHTIYNYIDKYNIPRIDFGSALDVAGQKFNKLTVIKKVGKSKNGTTIWECECECGKKRNVHVSLLKNGNVKSCGKCTYKYGIENHLWKGHGGISGNLWSSIKCCAKNRNINFNITIKEAWDLFEKQNNECALSDLPISLEQNFKTASLDRKDSSLGYSLDNVQWLHKDINKIKASLSIKDFINLCKLIQNPLIEQNSVNTNNLIIYKSFWKDIIYNAKKRKINFEIDKEYALELFIKQNGCCAITGQKIILPNNSQEYIKCINTASLDRIDNNLEYVENNLQWVHKTVNQSRKNLDMQYYKFLAALVAGKEDHLKLWT